MHGQRSGPACPRTTALDALERAASAPIQAALDEALVRAGLSRRDAGLATELAYGWLRWELRLDWLLGRFLRQPEKLPPLMRRMLGVAAYELLHLDRIPARATVHSWVGLMSRKFGQGLAKVANGVLRNLERLGPDIREEGWYGEQISDPLQRLAVFNATPEWMVRCWFEQYGEAATRQLLAAGQTTPWTCVRVNARQEGAAALRETLLQTPESRPVGRWGVAFSPAHRPDGLAEAHAAGLLSYHGGGSQMALEALVTAPLHELWDVCAGRGGKTLALMEQGSRVLLAGDTSLPRLVGLQTDAARLNLPTPWRYMGSGAEPPFNGPVASILLDVPCSGLGTLARRPDIRRLQRPEHLPPLYDVQKRLLHAAWARLAPGGQMIYMTCAVNRQENEEAVAALLVSHPCARLERQWTNALDPFRVHSGMDALFGAVIGKD